MSQLFPPPGGNCNEFGGAAEEVEREARPDPNLSQLFPPPGSNCNEFGGVAGRPRCRPAPYWRPDRACRASAKSFHDFAHIRARSPTT